MKQTLARPWQGRSGRRLHQSTTKERKAMNSLPVRRIAVSGLIALAAVSTGAWAQDKKAAGPNSGPKAQTV
jgi:hypothetical protein